MLLPIVLVLKRVQASSSSGYMVLIRQVNAINLGGKLITARLAFACKASWRRQIGWKVSFSHGMVGSLPTENLYNEDWTPAIEEWDKLGIHEFTAMIHSYKPQKRNGHYTWTAIPTA
jgi:hypothetical protein